MARSGEVALGAQVGNPNPVRQNLVRQNPVQHESDEESDEDDLALVGENQQGHRQNDYRIQADIPSFHGNLSIEDFLDWIAEVERAFDAMDTPPDKMVKLIAYKLKGGASVWWDQLHRSRTRQGKGPVRTWRRMKGLMREHFIPSDYEQHLYSLYLNCSQGNRSIHKYTAEFIRLSERNNLRETENQQVARYLSGLRGNIRDRMGLQPVYDVQQARSMALRAEEFERRSSANNFRRAITYAPLQNDKGKGVASNQNSTAPTPRTTTTPSRGNGFGSNTTMQQRANNNPYARPIPGNCYHCQKTGHRSNECPERRSVNLVDEPEQGKECYEEGADGESEEGDDAEYHNHEDGEQVSCVVQRVLCSAKQPTQRNSIFRSQCSINKKVCDLIVDSGSCENFVARRLVEYLNLPVEEHPYLYTIGWIQKGPTAKVTEVCQVPLSIGKSYSGEVMCDVVDMDASYILLGRPWQFDVSMVYDGPRTRASLNGRGEE